MFNPYNNPYNPYNFPYPMGQQAQQPQPTQQTGPDWITVQNIQNIEQVNVQPGTKAWVMVQNEPVFALRVADQMGLVTTSYYRFEKYDPAANAQPAPDYVTREEFMQFVNSLNQPRKGGRNNESVNANDGK